MSQFCMPATYRNKNGIYQIFEIIIITLTLLIWGSHKLWF